VPVRVLLIEEDPLAALAVGDSLDRPSPGAFQITTVSSAEEAIARLSTGTFEVVLLDPASCAKGRRDAPLDAVWRIVKSASSTPVVMLLGAADQFAADELVRTGAADYVVSDRLEPGELVRRIAFVLERSADARLHRLNRLYIVLSRVSAAIVRTKDERALLQEVCRIAVTDGGLRVASIAALDPATGDVRPVALAGDQSDRLTAVRASAVDAVLGAGTVGTALRTGQPDIRNDVSADARMAPWRDKLEEFGIRSAASFPIVFGGAPVAALALFASEANYFRDDETELMVAVANDLSFALDSLRRQEQQQLAKDELRTSQANLATAQEIGHFGSWELDLTITDNLNTNPLRWSDEMYRIAGFEPGEVNVTNDLFFSLAHPDDHAAIRAAVAEAIATRTQYSIVHRLIRPDGDERIIHEIAQLFVDDNTGQPVRMVGTAHDITAITRATEETRLQARRLAALVEAQQELTALNVSSEELIGHIAGMAARMTGADGASFERIDGDSLVMQSVTGLAAGLVGLRLPFDGTLSGESVRTGRTLRCDDAETDPRVDAGLCRQTGVRSLLAAVLRFDSGPVGVIKALSSRPRAFSDGDADGLELLAGSLGAVIQRRRAAEQMRASEAQYRLLFSGNPQPMWVFDIETLRFLAVNSAALQQYGYTEAEFLQMAIGDLRLPEAAEAIRQHGVRHLTSPLGRIVHQRKDRSLVDVEVTFTDITFGGRQARMVLASDVTARVRAEEERQRVDLKLREQASLLDKARDAIIVRDLAHQILYWNKSAERLYGWTTAEAVGQTVRTLLYREFAGFDDAMMTVQSEGEWIGEVDQVAKDGRSLTVEARWTLVRDDEGTPRAVLAINTDVTERKRLEKQFLRAQRLESIGTLAGGIAHDLNNVLAPILMGIEMLKLDETAEEKLSVLTAIEASAKRGADMVRQVLSFARGVEGRRLEIQVRHLLNDIEKIVNETFLKSIQVTAEAPEDLRTVSGDPTQLHQVLLNLCVNARDAMPNGGALRLSATNLMVDDHEVAINSEARPGPYVVIEIQDTGTGMTPAVLDKIFEPFFTTKEVGKGTGLGLSTSMAIVRSHGGYMRVQSAPGAGTSFSVFLPALTEACAEAAQPEQLELPRGNGELVLVVDDEPSVRHVTQQTLEAFGYRVVVATDGADGLLVYAKRKHDIAVILTDMMMPVLDGPSAIREFLKLNPAARIIAASGIAAESHRAHQAGAKHFLTKPYTAHTLLGAIKAALSSH
jgi:PAS domain S-box-containing protein